MSSLDQTVIKAVEIIRTMADHMNLGRNIIDRANALFKQVHNGKHLKGHSTNVSAATCLHIACRWVENIWLLIQIFLMLIFFWL